MKWLYTKGGSQEYLEIFQKGTGCVKEMFAPGDKQIFCPFGGKQFGKMPQSGLGSMQGSTGGRPPSKVVSHQRASSTSVPPIPPY